MSRLLIVTAVATERDAVLRSLTPAAGELAGYPAARANTPAGLVDVVAGGVGPAAAALATGLLLAGQRYDLVIAAGIAGGLGPAALGAPVVADRVAFADLGAQLADGGFADLTELDLGQAAVATDPTLARLLADRTGATTGTVLTVSTVTGTQHRADRLAERWPDAIAEGMEGAAVALAAGRAGVPFGELRTVSNRVGPRDRSSWRLAEALAGLATAFDRTLATPLITGGTG